MFSSAIAVAAILYVHMPRDVYACTRFFAFRLFATTIERPKIKNPLTVVGDSSEVGCSPQRCRFSFYVPRPGVTDNIDTIRI